MKWLVGLLILCIGWIGYDQYLHYSARTRIAATIKADSIDLVAIRDSGSKVAEKKDSVRTDLLGIQKRYDSARNTVRTRRITVQGRPDTSISSTGTTNIVRVDTVYAPDSAAIRQLTRADSIINGYREIDILWSRSDSLHHREVENLERQNRNLKIMLEKASGSNLKKTAGVVIVTIGVIKGIEFLVK